MSGTLGVRVVVTGDIEEHGVCLAVERACEGFKWEWSYLDLTKTMQAVGGGCWDWRAMNGGWRPVRRLLKKVW